MPASNSQQQVERAVIEQLAWDARVDASNIDVEVTEDAVTLKGRVPGHFARQAALDSAAAVCGDRDVRDQMTVSPAAASPAPDAEKLRLAVESVLGWLPDVEIQDCAVRVADGAVNIEGCVDALWKKAQAGEAVRELYGVVELENKLTVVPSGSRLDREIARDVESSLDRHALIDAESITVEVDNGVVTLSGRIPGGTAKQAALDAALHTPGVLEIEDRVSAKRGTSSHRNEA